MESMNWALDTVLVTVVETALSVVVNRDPDWQSKVAPLQGKVIQLELTDFAKSLYFLPTSESILVQSEFQASPENKHIDVSIRGSIAGFLGMLEARRKGEKVIGGDVKFEGNVGVGQEFEILLSSLSPEWEESLSRVVGDPMARKITEINIELGKYLRQAVSTISENTTDYIQHEAQLSPAPIEIENFKNDVSDLRSDLARMEARVKQIQKQQSAEREKSS
jgi:ubiquinone biosynthesis protein UbiJ